MSLHKIGLDVMQSHTLCIGIVEPFKHLLPSNCQLPNFLCLICKCPWVLAQGTTVDVRDIHGLGIALSFPETSTHTHTPFSVEDSLSVCRILLAFSCFFPSGGRDWTGWGGLENVGGSTTGGGSPDDRES